MALLNAFSKNTANNLQLDAGIIIKNLENPKSFNGTIPEGATLLGATSGGATFTAVPELRNLFEGIDGAKGNYKNGNVVDNWDISLTATVKEITAENLKLALAVGDVSDGEGSDKYKTLTPRMSINEADYLDNVCWLGEMKGSSEPMIIELKNVMNSNGVNFTAADKDTGGVELELKAHFDLSVPTEVPFRIYFPKSSSEVSLKELLT